MFRTLEAWCVFLTVSSGLGWGLPAQTARPILSFYANRGQAAPDVIWQARGRGFTVSFRQDSFTLQMFLAEGNRLTEQTISLAGAAGQIEPVDPLPGKVSFLRGSDSSRWVRGLSTYSRLRYKEVYPGIDLLFYGNQGKLEYDFVVAPGADPGRIRLRVNGMASVNGHGELQLGQGVEATLHRPVLYQNITGGKKMIAGSFARQADGSLVFDCGDYDRAKTLVIDPTVNLLYSTYLGGLHDDEAYALALDPQNNSYILGKSASTDYPIGANAYQNQRTAVGTYTYNMVLTKINPAGVLIYSTFIGDGTDVPFRTPVLAADAQGNAWIGGVTLSTTYPVTANAYQPVFPPPASQGGTALSPFLSEIGPDGSTLAYSTFFAGPTGSDYDVLGITVNGSGHVYLAGIADSGLPTTPGAYLATIPSGYLANFVAVFNPALTGSAQLLASSYFGMQNFQYTTVTGLALDASANPWITFNTNDTGLPTTANAIQPNAQFTNSLFCGEGIQRGLSDGGYVAKLSSDLTTVLYGSYLSGGQGDAIGSNPASSDAGCDESIVAAASDANGDLYMVGYSGSDQFPTTPGAYQTFQQDFASGAGPGLRFVAALSADGSQLLFSTFMGGTQYPGKADFLAVDGQQNAWIASNAAVPITAGALQSSLIPNQTNGSVAEISSDGTTLLYGTYLPQVQSPGPCYAIFRFNNDTTPCNLAIAGFAVDAQSNAYIAGTTSGAMVPVTANAFQSQFANGDANNDGSDIFFMILGGGAIGAISPTVGGNSGDSTITITGLGFQAGTSCSLVQNGNTISAQAVNVSSNGTSVTCTFALNGVAAGNYDVVVTNANGTMQTDPGAFTVKAGTGPSIWTNLSGRSLLRAGVPSTYYVTVGNSGDANAYFTRVWILVPQNFQFAYGQPVPDIFYPGDPADYSHLANPQYDPSGFAYYNFLLPTLAPGSVVQIPISITVPDIEARFALVVYPDLPWYGDLGTASASFGAALSSAGALPSRCANLSSNLTTQDCLDEYTSEVVSMTVDEVIADIGNINQESLSTFATTMVLTDLEYLVGLARQPYQPTSGRTLAHEKSGSSETKTAEVPEELVSGAVKWLGQNSGFFPGLNYSACNPSQAIATVKTPCDPQTCLYVEQLTYVCQNVNFKQGDNPQGEYIVEYAVPCGSLVSPQGNLASGSCPVVDRTGNNPQCPMNSNKSGGSGGQSCGGGASGNGQDPNEKTGPAGDGSANRWIANAPLTYLVAFENDPAATLPAAQVVITDQLNPALVNLNSLSLGQIAFGSNMINVPPNSTTYSTLYSISSSLSVNIQGSLNPSTGLLKWTFTSIDPSTGLPPSDPTVGFLPPDVNGIEGQGSVTFTVMLKGGQTTGTKVANQATVVFDTNAPISTQTWLNTLDANAPLSSVQPLPPTEAQSTFNVAWDGTDVGSGVSTYTIYVSQNGAPYTVFQNNVATTSASFTGQPGNSYAFYSIATDGAGNLQAAKTAADTMTTVVGGNGPGGACDIGNYGAVNVADIQEETNQALGITGAVNDLNGDKVVNVVDIQIVMNAALKLGCTQ